MHLLILQQHGTISLALLRITYEGGGSKGHLDISALSDLGCSGIQYLACILSLHAQAQNTGHYDKDSSHVMCGY